MFECSNLETNPPANILKSTVYRICSDFFMLLIVD